MAAASREASERSARERSTREDASRYLDVDPDFNLDFDATKVAPGKRYLWVRENVLGQHDRENVSRRMRRGWTPVPAERHPEANPPALPGETPDPLIRRGGMLLMEIPIEEARREDAAKLHANKQIMEAVDFDRREQVRKSGFEPVSEESTKIARGRFEEK